MADSSYEEHPDNPANIPWASPETIPNQKTEPANPTSENAIMEVHHHAHHGGKKNWKSYAWEFLMLFLPSSVAFSRNIFWSIALKKKKANNMYSQ